EIETISGGEEVLAGKWGGLFLGYLLGKNFWRRDRDHLVPPRRMNAAVCRAEVCYPFGREDGRHRAGKRRELITLLGGRAAWPIAARAQQGQRVRRVGVHMYWDADDAEGRPRLAAFIQALQQLGWSEGRNLRIDTRATANADELRRHAAE